MPLWWSGCLERNCYETRCPDATYRYGYFRVANKLLATRRKESRDNPIRPLAFAAVFNLLGNFDWKEHFEDAQRGRCQWCGESQAKRSGYYR